MNACFLVEEPVLSFSATLSVTRRSCLELYMCICVYVHVCMCIIYVQLRSILNFFILVILACIKVAKLIFFFFYVCENVYI